MAGPVLGVLGLVVLLVLVLLGCPVGLAFILTSIAGLVHILGLNAALDTLGSTAFSWATDYTFAAVPLFILMGYFAHHSGISRDLYEMGHRWVGRFRGGLAMGTIGACACFAALSGSSMATAVAMGSVSLPEMRRLGYSPGLSTGTVAIGGTLGILIPPSIPFIIYGILTETSISKLFIAGIIPGILMASLYCTAIYIITTINPKAGPQAPKCTTGEKLIALRKVWPMLVIFLSIMGGIYFGIATPTEAAAIGAMGSFIFVLGKRKLTWQNLNASLSTAAETSIMMITILIGAMAFSVFMALTRLPVFLADWVTGIAVNPYLVLATVLVLYIPLGCIMESLSMLILTIPLFFPTLEALGFSPILLGVLALRAIEIGLITPPVGLNVFLIKGVAEDVPISQIFKGVFPFLICDLVSLPILIAIPQISLFLPGLMS